MSLGKIHKWLFIIVLMLMPICSVHILPGLFKGWHINAAMIPLVLGMLVCLVDIKYCRNLLLEDENIKKIYRKIKFILLYTIFNTAIMYYIFLIGTTISNELTKKSMYIILLEVIVPFMIVTYSIVVTLIVGTKRTIKIILISMTIVVSYGYIQLLGTRTNSALFYNIYAFISDKLDYIWGSASSYQYAMVSQRLNLTTPEAAEAGAIINILYYTFIIPSIINNYTFFKRKVFGIFKVESIMFLFSLPIVVLSMSSNNYIILAIEIAVIIFYMLKNRKGVANKIVIIISIITFGVIIGSLMLGIEGVFAERLDYYITKVTDLGNKSTSTRLGLMVANISIFLRFFINGCGITNLGLLIPKYLPIWSFNEEISLYLFDENKWLAGARTFRMLSVNGVVGVIMIVSLIHYMNKIFKGYKNEFEKNIYGAFKFFVGISIIQGCTSGELKFIYLWVMCGLFVAALKKFGRNEGGVLNE
ncbi:hypothetical protein ACQPU1_10975 [Clostridium paraputrificum]|uniref:hypothetical protein n=1 Tax=Clostridium paraputrificum TaxID=29363 RepID=UPI003D343272